MNSTTIMHKNDQKKGEKTMKSDCNRKKFQKVWNFKHSKPKSELLISKLQAEREEIYELFCIRSYATVLFSGTAFSSKSAPE